MKEKLFDWCKNHPDVWHKNEHGSTHFWWVANCLGTLGVLSWDEIDEVRAEHEEGKTT